ncbi:MAG: hypothetical protein KGJ01_00915 [Patescibacteria group bacterium]|nr:hypothetical protein [Patescibacteria group bacterium]
MKINSFKTSKLWVFLLIGFLAIPTLVGGIGVAFAQGGATGGVNGGGTAGGANAGGGATGGVNPGTGNGVLQINPPSIGGNQLPGNAFDLLNQVINFLTIDVMPVVIALVVLWSAYLFLTAGGDPKKITTAKQALFWAIIGAVVIIIGQGIILVVKNFFGLPTS